MGTCSHGDCKPSRESIVSPLSAIYVHPLPSASFSSCLAPKRLTPKIREYYQGVPTSTNTAVVVALVPDYNEAIVLPNFPSFIAAHSDSIHPISDGSITSWVVSSHRPQFAV